MSAQNKLSVKETALFGMLGGLMFASKVLMEFLPNIHLIGMFIMAFTLVFRKKAVFPLYVYILLDGIHTGFNMWWVPYLYVWAVLWVVTLCLPKNMPKKIGYIVYPCVCALHGLLFGTLYSPAMALMMGMSFRETAAWIAAGFTFDAIHAAGNFAAGFLIIPLADLMKKLLKKGNI